MKVITLYQPWASLIALCVKGIETRSWYTDYRGLLGIHAGKRLVPFNEVSRNWRHEIKDYVLNRIIKAYGSYKNLPTGAIVAATTLFDVAPVEKELPFLGGVEISCGDYSPGRFAWKLHDTWELDNPIQVTGHQRLWNYTISETELRLNFKLRNADGSDCIPPKT